jgi:hypothetical protein
VPMARFDEALISRAIFTACHDAAPDEDATE